MLNIDIDSSYQLNDISLIKYAIYNTTSTSYFNTIDFLIQISFYIKRETT